MIDFNLVISSFSINFDINNIISRSNIGGMMFSVQITQGIIEWVLGLRNCKNFSQFPDGHALAGTLHESNMRAFYSFEIGNRF